MTVPGDTMNLAELEKAESPPRPKKNMKTSDAGKSIMIPENPSGPPLDDVSSLCPLLDESDALFLICSPFCLF